MSVQHDRIEGIILIAGDGADVYVESPQLQRRLRELGVPLRTHGRGVMCRVPAAWLRIVPTGASHDDDGLSALPR